MDALLAAARTFWDVPEGAKILATHGASAPIAALPSVLRGQTAAIPGPTYNEHAAAFRAHDWTVSDTGASDVQIIVNPNNPDGRVWSKGDLSGGIAVIDESFADVTPEHSLIAETSRADRIMLKSFGKFWGLAGLRLGFVIGPDAIISDLRERLGPWAVSGPALRVGTEALSDLAWVQETRARLAEDARRLDKVMTQHGAVTRGGTSLFRLYDVGDAAAFQNKLAAHHIWSRIFPYSETWVRLGLPAPQHWPRLETALRA